MNPVYDREYYEAVRKQEALLRVQEREKGQIEQEEIPLISLPVLTKEQDKRVSKNRCAICRREYRLTPSTIEWSRTCGQSECKKKLRESKLTEKKCVICGVDYKIKIADAEWSRTCKKTECKKALKESKKCTNICVICGNTYQLSPSQLEWSRTCRNSDCKKQLREQKKKQK